MPHDDLPFSPAAERNKGPILDVLRTVLPVPASVLEIASGTGQHAAHFAAAEPQWDWQPSEADVAALPAIAQRCAALPNVRPPVVVDVLAAWPETLGRFDAVYSANMLHISPWAACPALMAGASRHVGDGGVLVLYGPYILDGEPTAPSNLAFDADLRARDGTWGLRKLSDVAREAARVGFAPAQRVAMPANNLVLVFRRTP